MPLDIDFVGRELNPVTMEIERGRLRAFAEATGQGDPVYTDLNAAQAAGHRDLPVPPSFLFAIELEQPDPFAWLAELDVDLRHLLHGEQRFIYRSVAHAGDVLTSNPRIKDVYSKKGGALDFIVKESRITGADGVAVAEATSVLVVQNRGVA